MTTRPLEFIRPDDLDTDELVRVLKSAGRVRRGALAIIRRDFYDTFDWRLYRKGQRLEASETDRGPWIVWRKLGGESLGRLDVPPPRFAWDLPQGPFRQRLEDALEMRALLPVARIETRSERLEVRNREGKVLCRVFGEKNRAGDPEREGNGALQPRVRVEPVRGYSKTLDRVIRGLQEGLELDPVSTDVLEEALAALGKRPGEYSSKVRVDLRPEMPAAEATRLVLLRLLQTMEVNEDGTRRDLDSEFLHDFRVAVRRTRSALTQIKGVLPPDVVDRFLPEFAWLGSITGPTRDLDVYLLEFPGFREALPPDVAESLKPLWGFLVSHQKTEQRKLARELRSPRYRKIVRNWHAYLQAPSESAAEAPRGLQPIAQVARERIRKVFKRTLKEGGAIHEGSPAEMLHELRKTCKKLRYLLEFFQSLYPPEEIGGFIKALKELQDNLGEFQDLEVQAEALRRFSGQMAEEGEVPAGTQLAMGILVERLHQRQVAVRGEFSRRFGAFGRPSNRRRFERLFESPPAAAKEAS